MRRRKSMFSPLVINMQYSENLTPRFWNISGNVIVPLWGIAKMPTISKISCSELTDEWFALGRYEQIQ